MRRSWSQIKLIALVMLLTVIAHDAVMAGDPHTAPHVSNQSHHTSIDHQTRHPGQIAGQRDGVTSLIGHDGAPQTTHGASPCGVLAATRPTFATDLLPEPVDAGAAPPLAADPGSDALPERAGTPGPVPSPRVRRALLQVFLN